MMDWLGVREGKKNDMSRVVACTNHLPVYYLKVGSQVQSVRDPRRWPLDLRGYLPWLMKVRSSWSGERLHPDQNNYKIYCN